MHLLIPAVDALVVHNGSHSVFLCFLGRTKLTRVFNLNDHFANSFSNVAAWFSVGMYFERADPVAAPSELMAEPAIDDATVEGFDPDVNNGTTHTKQQQITISPMTA